MKMKQKRVQKSLVEQFFYTFMSKGVIIPWDQRLGENYQKEYDPAGRYSEDTIFNEQFLKSLGMRELQRLNRSISGSSMPQGSDKEFAIEEIMSKIGVQTIHVDKSRNLLTGKEEKVVAIEEDEYGDYTIKENINVVVDEENSESSSEVCFESYVDQNNSTVVTEPTAGLGLLETENMVSGAIIAKLTMLEEKVGIIIDLLSNPIFAANSVGVEQVDLKIPIANKLSIEEIKMLSIEDLRKFAEQLGLPSTQYHTVLRENVIKEHGRLHKIVEISEKHLISTIRAEKALLMSEQTGVSLEKAIQVC